MIYLVTGDKSLFESTNYKIIGVKESLELLSPLHIVGLDTETQGLDPYTKELLSVQLGCKEFQIVIDCTTIDITLYKEYLESDRLFLGQNLKFDLKFLYHKRIIPKKVYDGFLAEKLMWLGYPLGIVSMSLKAAGMQYLGIELDKSVRGKIIWNGLKSEDTIVYAANDVKFLEDIYNTQLKKLKEKDLLRAIDYENRFVLPLAYCEYCGVKLDINKWKSKMAKDKEREELAKKKLDEELIKLNTEGYKPANIPPGSFSKYIFINTQGDLWLGYDLTPKVSLNWSSPKQVISLFKMFGVDVEVKNKRTGDTSESIESTILKPQSDKCSLIPLYINYREAIKVTSTYGENFLKQINPISGRIHTNYSQLGADTTKNYSNICIIKIFFVSLQQI